MENPQLTVTTFTNGSGTWRAQVDFSHTLSESDDRDAFNLGVQWPRIRRAALKAIIREIAIRELTTRETYANAERRVSAYLRRENPRGIPVVAQDVDSLNRWHSVTFGETA